MTKPQSEDEFRHEVFLKHERHFVHVYRLHQFAEESMVNYKGVVSTAYKTAMWLILGRAYKSFDSIRRLCEVSNCEDAGVVLRSLLNLLAITRWISVDPEGRAKKYLGWYWVDMKENADRHRTRIPTEWVDQIEKNYQATKKLFEYKDSKQNIRMARKWYEPEAWSIKDLCAQVGLEVHYEDAYKPLSGVEHSDATSYFPMVMSMEKGDTENSLALQSDIFLPHYLRNSFQYFADIFEIANDALSIVETKELSALKEEGKKFYATHPRYTP